MRWPLKILMSVQKHSRGWRLLRTHYSATCGSVCWSDGWVVRLGEQACGFSHDICARIVNRGFHCFRQRRGECIGKLAEHGIGLSTFRSAPFLASSFATTCSLRSSVLTHDGTQTTASHCHQYIFTSDETQQHWEGDIQRHSKTTFLFNIERDMKGYQNMWFLNLN